MFTFLRRSKPGRRTPRQRATSRPLRVKTLEDRCLLSTYSSVILADSPAAYYRLGELAGTTAVDSSGNNNSGAYLGGVTHGQPGAVAGDPGTSATFDGSTGIVDTNFQPADASFTIEAWINPTAAVNTQWQVAGRGGGSQLAYNAWDGVSQPVHATAGYAGISIFNGTAFDVTLTSAPLPLNHWTYLVGTWDDAAKTLSIYENGVLNNSRSFPGDSSVQNDAFATWQVGAFNETLHGGTYNAGYFSGGIDEVAYYAKALTAAQVEQHYQAGTQLVVTIQPPAHALMGTAFDVRVAAQDVNGNVNTGFAGPVTIALGNNPGGGTLGGTLTANAVNGVADFPDLTLDQTGLGYTLQVTSTGVNPGTTAAFDVANAGSSIYAAAILADHPTAYYRLGEAAGPTAADSSGNNNNGTSLGGVIQAQSGALAGDPDTSATFNGSSGMIDTNFQPADASFTIEAWISPTAAVAKEWLVAGRVSSAGLAYNAWDGFSQPVHATPGYAGIGFFNGTSFDVTLTSGVLPLNQWTYLVGTWDDATKTLSIYENGILNNSKSFLGDSVIPGTTYGTWQMGAANDTLHGGTYNAEYFSGGIDEVAYYPQALTAAQIEQHYQAGTQLVVTTEPPPQVGMNTPFDVKFSAEDIRGTVNTSFTGPVTIALGSNPGGSALGGTLTVNAVNGVADFPNLTLDQPGQGYTLQVTSSGVNPGATAAFSVADTVANAGGPYTISEGQPLTLDASLSTDPDGETLSYSWTINGQANAATGVNPTLTWSQLQALGIDDGPAAFNVQVSVDDGHGAVTDSPVTTLTLNNTAPTAGVSGPIDGFHGIVAQVRTFALTAADTSATDQAAGFTFAVNWGDGTSETDSGLSGLLVSHTYAAPGPYTVSVTATNEDGGTSAPVTLPLTILTTEQQGTTLAEDVYVSSPWQDTGIDVLAGQTLTMTTDPNATVSFGWSYVNANGVGPAEGGTATSPTTILPNTIQLSLVGKSGGTTDVGTGTPLPEGVPGNGPGFVGTSYQQIVPVSGRLFLGFNDDYFPDNSGAFPVMIQTDQLVVSTPPPATVVTGRPFDVQVSALDVNGNVDTNFTGSVTMALGRNPAGGTLGGTLTVNAVGGVADFPDLTLDQPGQGYILQATATGLNPATTGTFNVTDPAGGPYSIQEGQSLTLDASGLIAPATSGLTYSWAINGQANGATGINPTLSWPQLQALSIDDGPGTFSIQVAADDSQGNQVGSATTTLTLNNTVPAAGVAGPTDGFHGVEGQARTFTLTAADASAGDQAAGFSFAVNWGDGTSETDSGLSGLLVNHTYTAPGPYTVSVTATNEDGSASVPVTLPITILTTEQQGTTLAVGGGSGNDAYAFTAGGKSGTVIVKDNAKSLGTFTTAQVQVYGGGGVNTITVNGSKTGTDAFTIASSSVAVRGVLIAGNNIAGWAINGGDGTNTFAINGSGLAAALTGGPNNDTFTVAAGVVFDGSIKGGGGNDTLVAKSVLGANTAWLVSGANTGTLNGTPFTAIANLAGGAGNDVFQLGASGSVSGTITGGGGSDWLDYSDFGSMSPVQVDLPTGSATAVNGGAAGGVSGIINVRGGQGNDTLIGGGGNILIGGGGNDVLTDSYNGSRRTGRSLLIGGAGADRLLAGAAGDLLIGGTTAYDNNNAALAAILAEWQSADSYNTRFDRLEGLQSGGLNGSFTLVWGSTVLDDGTPDTLIGSTTGLDWFFAQLTGGNADTILNRNLPGHEHVNNRL